MLDCRHDLAPCSTIGAKLVCDDALGYASLLLHQADQKTFGSLGVPAYLDHLVEHVAVLVDGTPGPVFAASDCLHKASGMGGFYPPRSLRIGHDALASSGSHCSAVSMKQRPMGEQPRLVLRDAQKPMPGSTLVPAQGLVFSRSGSMLPKKALTSRSRPNVKADVPGRQMRRHLRPFADLSRPVKGCTAAVFQPFAITRHSRWLNVGTADKVAVSSMHAR